MASIQDTDRNTDMIRLFIFMLYLSLFSAYLFISLTAGRGLEEAVNVRIFTIFGVLIPLSFFWIAL